MLLSVLMGALLVISGCRQEPVMSAVMNFFHQEAECPPVIVSDPAGQLPSAVSSFQFAGMTFVCNNTSAKRIRSLEVSFIAYTSKAGGNPFYGSNVITALVTADIPSDSSATCEISLDEHLACIPGKPLFIDCFHVTKVAFEDGSEWTDPYGFYYMGSLLP